MKTLKTYLNENSVMAFHIYGGGGNRRHIECLGEHKIGEFTDDLWAPVDGDGNDIEGEYTTDTGNLTGLTTAMVKSGIGRIDIDGDYDTIYTKRLGDINYTDEEASAMAQSTELSEEWVVGYFCNGETDEKAKAIIGKLGLNIDEYFDEAEDEETYHVYINCGEGYSPVYEWDFDSYEELKSAVPQIKMAYNKERRENGLDRITIKCAELNDDDLTTLFE